MLMCDNIMSPALDFYGESTQVELEMCLSFIKEGDWVIDAGANIGTYTIPFARRVGSAGFVFAFEPQMLVHMALTTNVFINSLGEWCQPIPNALGETEGMAKIARINPRKPNNTGGARINDETNFANLDRVGVDPVKVITIDSLNLERLDFIKVDTEGMDSKVLRGGIQTIKRTKPTIVAEILGMPVNEPELENMRNVLDEIGYRAWRVPTPIFNPNNSRMEKQNVFGGLFSSDILAIPKDKPMPDCIPNDSTEFTS